MNFGKIQKSILVLEVVAIIAGGGVLAFVPKKAPRPPKIAQTSVAFDTSSLTRNPIEMLSEEERAKMEDKLKVDINSASADELMNIPRVGASTADAIVKYREEHGPFKTFEELDAIPRIGPSLIAVLPKYARLSGADSATPQTSSSSEQGLDLNTATVSELMTIPGVGQSTAEKIISARPFSKVEDLLNVPGIGEAKFERWKSYLRVSENISSAVRSASSASSTLVNINTASAEELQKIHGVGPPTATAIVDYREKNGRFSKIEDLDNVPRIGPAFIEKVRSQVSL